MDRSNGFEFEIFNCSSHFKSLSQSKMLHKDAFGLVDRIEPKDLKGCR